MSAYRACFQNIKFDLAIFVPPTESKDLVRNFAERVAKALDIPISYNLQKKRDTKPQKVFQNSWNKKDNVDGAFEFKNPEELEGRNILLIDDIYDSGATIKEIAKTLVQYKINLLAPLVIAKTVGSVGDSDNVLSPDNLLKHTAETTDKKQGNDNKELNYIEKQREKHPNAYKPWSDVDDKRLVDLHKAGMSVAQLSEFFNRNKGAIRSRLKKLS